MKLIALFFYFYVALVAGLLSRKVSFSNIQNIISPAPNSPPNQTETKNCDAKNGQNDDNGTTNNEESANQKNNAENWTPKKKSLTNKNGGILPPKKPSELELGAKNNFVQENNSAIGQAMIGASKPKKKQIINDESSILPYYRLKHFKSMPVNRVTPEENEQENDPDKAKVAKKVNVIADGNCLFRSFAVSLYGRDNGNEHKKLRKAAAKTLAMFESDPTRSAEDQEKMKNMVMANLPAGQEMSKYNDSIAIYAIKYVFKDAKFVGLAECQALAIHLDRPVALINSRLDSVTVFHPDFTQTEHGQITKDKYKQIWLLENNPIVIWHDGSIHFNSIRLVNSAMSRSMSQKFTQHVSSLLECFSVDYVADSSSDGSDEADDEKDLISSLYNKYYQPQRSFKMLPSQQNPFRRNVSGLNSLRLSGYFNALKDVNPTSSSVKTPLIDFSKYDGEEIEPKSEDEKGSSTKRINPFLKPDGGSYKEKDDDK